MGKDKNNGFIFTIFYIFNESGIKIFLKKFFIIKCPKSTR